MTVIEVHDLRKTYGRTTAVAGVSFSVTQGEIFGVLGPNGAGKTTTVECLTGLRTPDSGTVRVLGRQPGDRELRQQIGVQLQQSSLHDSMKVHEALQLYASFYDSPRDWSKLLGQWGLAEKRNSTFKELSGGQRQRLFIALALIGDPRVVFLDELTTGLDPQARRATWELIRGIREQGVTVVLVSHFMDEVEELCDRVAIFDRGRIVALDSPAGLIATAASESRLRFRPMAAFDERALRHLPGVTEVRRDGEQVIVSGVGEFHAAVTAALARAHVLVAELRLDQQSLDDAYLALTGSRMGENG
ncbi:ABC transporter ATP-binding protein [Pseudonocardiaceae bacterium YIM PH 21723]|nr:ABC transporter ATP-binding protein [Pseudonocardiaceae bacterium YIM PH 21723]